MIWEKKDAKGSQGSWLLNGVPSLITHQAAEKFIELIHRERTSGYGFVPLVGAGFSAPSGAPLVWDMKPYLQRCICVALGAEERHMRTWNPRTDQWPPFIDRDRPEPTDWRLMVSTEFDRRRDAARWDPELPIFEEALGAMAEWRTSLLFLSRLVRDQRGEGLTTTDVVSLDASHQEIIDSCLVEVLKDRYPTLGHRMLAACAGLLRLDVLLTTNFDDLLERAFALARNDLKVSEVHLGGELPDWSTVFHNRTLIKMHGNRHSLRADYSLDAPPSEPDMRRFLEYLLSPSGRIQLSPSVASQPGIGDSLDFQNHLLVMGFFANERRIRALIKNAWRHLRNDFTVYWLCYSEGDVENIQQMTLEFLRGLPEAQREKRETENWVGSVILRHTNQGLFFLQLYQTIRMSLPPISSLFPSLARLALPPLASAPGSDPLSREPLGSSESHFVGFARFSRSLKDRLALFQKSDFRHHKPAVVTSKDGVYGVTSICGEVFRDIESDYACLWLDMNDIASTDNLFETLLEAAYVKIGIEHWTPVYMPGKARSRAAEMQRLARSVNKPWVIFLNARETPGANTPPQRASNAAKGLSPNGWMDYDKTHDEDADDQSDTQQEVLELLTELCGANPLGKESRYPAQHTPVPFSPRISVVLMCRQSKAPESAPGLIEGLTEQRLISIGDVIELDTTETKSKDFVDDVVRKTFKWIGDGPSVRKGRFLQTLVLMQRPRLLATIWSDAVSSQDTLHRPVTNTGTDSDIKEGLFNDEHAVWVNELEGLGLVRRKAGGFIWIHSRCREQIRRELTEYKPTDDWNPKMAEPRIHAELAQWYDSVLEASDAPAAVFEIVYHLCRAAESDLALQAQAGQPKAGDAGDIEFAEGKLEAASARICLPG